MLRGVVKCHTETSDHCIYWWPQSPNPKAISTSGRSLLLNIAVTRGDNVFIIAVWLLPWVWWQFGTRPYKLILINIMVPSVQFVFVLIKLCYFSVYLLIRNDLILFCSFILCCLTITINSKKKISVLPIILKNDLNIIIWK